MHNKFPLIPTNDIPQKVAILLGTHNGEKFLPEQMDSYAAQTYTNWEVWASDDGSQDTTRSMLEAYRSQWTKGRLLIHSGPKLGFASNFLFLIDKANGHADFYAFSDQDDIWESEKLERAVKWLKTIPSTIPALYCTASIYIDKEGNRIGSSTRFLKPPSFRNALIQNIAGGNTMVFNQATSTLLEHNSQKINVPFHDWWAYLLVTGHGGIVRYDPHPTVRYRQHGGNLAGENMSFGALWARAKMLKRGKLKEWIDQNLSALKNAEKNLTSDNKTTLELFQKARQSPLFKRIWLFQKARVYRQTKLGNLAFFIATIPNCI